MAKGTRYTRIVAPKKAPKVEFANVTAQMRSNEALMNNIGRMGDFIYGQQLRKKRKEEAIQERIDLTNNVNNTVNKVLKEDNGAQNYLSRLKEQGGPQNLVELQTKNQLVQLEAKQYAFNTAVKLNKFIPYAQENNYTSDEFNKIIDEQIMGSWAATEEFFDESTRADLILNLQSSGSDIKNNFNNWRVGEDFKLERLEFENEHKDILGFIQDTAKRLSNTNFMDDETFKGKLDLLFDQVETVKNRMITMRYPESTIKNYENKAIKTFFNSFVMHGAKTFYNEASRQSMDATKGQISNFVGTIGKMLNISDYDQGVAIERIMSDIKGVYTINVTRSKDIIKDTNAKINNMTLGMKLPENYISTLKEEIINLNVNNKIKEALNGQVARLEFFENFQNATQKKTLQELEVMANDIELNGIKGFGVSGRDQDIEQDAFEFINKKINAKKQNVETGNYHHDAMLSGIIDQTPPIINFTADSNLDVRDIKENTDKRIHQAMVLKSHYGLDYLPILNNTEIDMVNQTLQSNNPDVSVEAKIQVIDNVVSGIGADYIDDVMRQLAPKNAYLATVAYLVHSGNAHIAVQALKGRELGNVKNITFGDDYSQKGNRDSLRLDQKMNSALYLVDELKVQEIYNLADDIFKYQFSLNPETDYEKSFMNNVQTIVGANDIYGGIQEVRGAMTVVPSYMTAKNFEDMIENIIEDPNVYKQMSISEENPDGIVLSENIRNALKDTDYEIKMVNDDTYYFVLDPLSNAPTILTDENMDVIRIHPSSYKKPLKKPRDLVKEAEKTNRQTVERK